MTASEHKLVVFKGKNIRRSLHNDEWHFSVIDVVAALTNSENPRRYWSDLKRKLLEEEGFSEVYEKIVQLKLEAPDGKKYETDTASAETLFRVIQSIPSPKKEDREFSILTAEISKATFGLTPNEYKEHKGLKRENLRDHMDDLELIFSMLGEAATTEITRNKDAQGFVENKDAAQRGGKIAGDARKKLEIESGRRVVSKENYLSERSQRKQLGKP